MSVTRCPCGLGDSYETCCGPVHGGAKASTAAQVMRARYSAFAVGREDYLLASWHPDTRPADLELEPTMRWVGLEMIGTSGGGLLDRTATVEFTARYREGMRDGELHEVSRFDKVDGVWLYVEADEAALGQVTGEPAGD